VGREISSSVSVSYKNNNLHSCGIISFYEASGQSLASVQVAAAVILLERAAI